MPPESQPLVFRDRVEAGQRLASHLERYAARGDVLVLALPRGGVPVAAQVAEALGSALDVFVVRKLGVPGHEELAMGALAMGGRRVLNSRVVEGQGLSIADVEAVTAAERAVVEARGRTYRGERPPPPVEGRTVILVDDGVATGATMRVALETLREQAPARLVVAVPVASRPACADMEALADEVICVVTPEPFQAVGSWYEDFSQTTDEEVRALLARARAPGGTREELVRVPVGGTRLEADLALPDGARGVVVFAHGSGSSRHSPRNRYVAEVLRDAGLGTVLVDLLTKVEEQADQADAHLRFDIALLAERVVGLIDWLARHPATAGALLGLFGASTGAAAALVAAAERPGAVGAVVSRGGRPDLAGEALAGVGAPTLLVVGGADAPVIELNRRALDQLRVEAALEIVPGATHLFEEPGTLEQVARLAAEWYVRHLAPGPDAEATAQEVNDQEVPGAASPAGSDRR